MNEETFIEILKDPIAKKRELEKDTKFADDSDLAVVYRIMNDCLNLWKWTYEELPLNETKTL